MNTSKLLGMCVLRINVNEMEGEQKQLECLTTVGSHL